MKPKYEKAFFIKKKINNNISKKQAIITKNRVISFKLNKTPNATNRKKCYIKPHPIFIISNLYKKNNFGFNINNQNENNFHYIKTINTERNQYRNYNIEEQNKLTSKYKNDENNIIKSKSYEIISFEPKTKIEKYFNNKYQKIKSKNNIYKLNSLNNNKIIKYETNENFTNYLKYKLNSLDYIYDNKKIKIKSSNSADIVNLCKVLKSLYRHINKGVSGKKRKNKFDLQKIILIQKWWKDMIYKIYLKKKIIQIQKYFRGYIYRKRFLQFLYQLNKLIQPENIHKIIIIQKFWKNYLMNKNQISLSFSFTNNEDNEDDNTNNNRDIIYIDNNNTNHKENISNNKEKKINYIIIKKSGKKFSFFSKKYYSKISPIISNIILIQRRLKKFLFYKHKNNNINIQCTQNIYRKKSLKTKIFKSRNKKENIISNNIEINNNMIFKSLIIVSPEKEFIELSFHTPKKEKNKIFTFEDIINNKEKDVESIFNRQLNNACYISKIRKNIDLLKRINIIKKHIIKYLRKFKNNKYNINILKDMNNICFITKSSGYNIISNDLKYKIIFLQMNIKKFLKVNSSINCQNNIIKSKNKNTTNKNFFTKDNSISTNDISNKKNYEQNLNKQINIADFSLNDKECRNDKNENSFISNNLNAFSFDFKNDNIDDGEILIHKLSNKKDNNYQTINFCSKNLLIYTEKFNSYKKLRKIFIATITNKFAIFLMKLLNKLHLYNFLKLFIQKINKSVNQYIYYHIWKNKKEEEIFFFKTLKRHIKYNIDCDDNNEIKTLLIENLPKCFHYFNNSIPYINQIQENNLINTQLFINNNNILINYINNFYNNEQKCFSFNQVLLKNLLNKFKLKNRNLFTLTKYFDEAMNLVLNDKLCKKCFNLNKNCICININNNKSNFNYIKKKCIYISNLTKKKKEKEENINDEFFNMIDEEDNNIEEFDENDSFNFNNTLNKSHNLTSRRKNFGNLFTYYNDTLINTQEYKFFDYLNEKCKNNKYNETVLLSQRDPLISFKNFK